MTQQHGGMFMDRIPDLQILTHDGSQTPHLKDMISGGGDEETPRRSYWLRLMSSSFRCSSLRLLRSIRCSCAS
jgi:hypothetical protein